MILNQSFSKALFDKEWLAFHSNVHSHVRQRMLDHLNIDGKTAGTFVGPMIKMTLT